MIEDLPIGVFDSGVGGLTVLRAMHNSLPCESTIYVGDLAYFPYGPKAQEVVCERALSIRDYLIERSVKAIVVACNTATSAALKELVQSSPCPVIGVVEPGANAAVALSASNTIGVVATEGTTRSQAYRAAVLDICPSALVTEMACGSLVGLIESGEMSSRLVNDVVKETTEELITLHGCDTIILGCTHFPLVRAMFEQASNGRATIVDSVSTTVDAIESLLTTSGLLSQRRGQGSHEILVTAHADAFVRQARVLFGEHVDAALVDIPNAPCEPIAAAS